MKDVIVRCYSGHTYAQEPTSFMWEGKEIPVTALRSRRRVRDQGTNSTVDFVVEAGTYGVFRLSYNEPEDTWSVGPVWPRLIG